MKFQHYETSISRFGGLKNDSLESMLAWHPHFLSEVKATDTQLNYEIEHNVLASEEAWVAMGRPYFKVWPAMFDLLKDTKMLFGFDSIKMPFSAIAVLLPESFPCKCLLLQPTGFNQAPDTPTAVFSCSFQGSHKTDDRRSSFGLWENQTVEQALQRFVDIASGDVPFTGARNDSPITRSVQGQAIRTAIAVAMFAVNRHELVAPDIDREILVRKFPGGKSKASQKIAEEKRQREIAKVKGWKVGSEIDLPRPRVITQGHPPERGGELSCGHVRSGHMKMQPCGPRNQDRKLIFVAPTVVRPDLPIRAQHGYRIRTPEERKQGVT